MTKRRKPVNVNAMTRDGNIDDASQHVDEYVPLQSYDPKMLDRVLRMKPRQIEVYIRNGQRKVAVRI